MGLDYKKFEFFCLIFFMIKIIMSLIIIIQVLPQKRASLWSPHIHVHCTLMQARGRRGSRVHWLPNTICKIWSTYVRKICFKGEIVYYMERVKNASTSENQTPTFWFNSITYIFIMKTARSIQCLSFISVYK